MIEIVKAFQKYDEPESMVSPLRWSQGPTCLNCLKAEEKNNSENNRNIKKEKNISNIYKIFLTMIYCFHYGVVE